MLYQKDAPGDWGQAQATANISVTSEHIAMADGCKLFLRGWVTRGDDVLLILHGLGGHGAWYIDMANRLAGEGLTVYTVDHRGFGRSEGLRGHVESYQTFVEDCVAVIREIHKRHEHARVYVLGHSMGARFATYVAAGYGDLLAGVTYLNPWVQETITIPIGKTLAIFAGGVFKSRRSWQVADGSEVMTTNAEARAMLETDVYWQRTQTASFLVQLQLMRLGLFKQARRVGLPVLMMQAEEDRSVVISASRALYAALGSGDKTWKTYPGYAHDSQLEADRSQMDEDIVAWIREHGASTDSRGVLEDERQS